MTGDTYLVFYQFYLNINLRILDFIGIILLKAKLSIIKFYASVRPLNSGIDFKLWMVIPVTFRYDLKSNNIIL